jgi:hypothetical protein
MPPYFDFQSLCFVFFISKAPLVGTFQIMNGLVFRGQVSFFLHRTFYTIGPGGGAGVRHLRGAAAFLARFGGATTLPSRSGPPAAFLPPFLTRGDPAVG